MSSFFIILKTNSIFNKINKMTTSNQQNLLVGILIGVALSATVVAALLTSPLSIKLFKNIESINIMKFLLKINHSIIKRKKKKKMKKKKHYFGTNK